MNDPTGCRHENRTLGRSYWPNGDHVVWLKCDTCDANINGAGKWFPRSELAYHNIDDLPVFEDRRHERPPCRVCGGRGTEIHHWAPKEVFGPVEADLWPVDYLCRPCHGRWHVQILKLKHNVGTRTGPE